MNPVNDSVHVVYRHGKPTNFAYRTSADTGQIWAGGGVSSNDDEEPTARPLGLRGGHSCPGR